MATDSDRREVARRLREMDDSELQVYDMTYFAIQRAVGGEGDRYPDGRELVGRLADLIEPPARCPHYHSGRHYCSVHEDMALIDRDALLALADELEEDACWEVQSPGVDNRAWMLKDVCDRIREACGEAGA